MASFLSSVGNTFNDFSSSYEHIGQWFSFNSFYALNDELHLSQ